MSTDSSDLAGSVFHPAVQSALSFVVCLSDDALLQANLLASPCLGPGSPHEVIAIRNAPSAADGLNMGLERAKNEWVVYVHQDVFLPRGWDRLLALQYRLAERRFGPIGIAGVYGVGDVVSTKNGNRHPRPARGAGSGDPRPALPDPRPALPEPRPALAVERIGRVVDRGRVLHDGPELPARVATLDELLLVLPRNTSLRFDPELGFHLYGADLCLQARERSLAVVAIDAPCHHNSRSIGLPEAFFPSARVFARKWARCLPIATPCVVFDRQGPLFVLGNAGAPDGRAVARAEASLNHG